MTSRHHPTINPYVSDEMVQAFLRDLPAKEAAQPLRIIIMAAHPDNLSQRTHRMRELLEAAGCEVKIVGPHEVRSEPPPRLWMDELTPWDRMPWAYPDVMTRPVRTVLGQHELSPDAQVRMTDGAGCMRLYDVISSCLRIDLPPGHFTVEYPYQAPTKATADYKKTPLERLKNRKPAGGCHPLLRGLINRADR